MDTADEKEGGMDEVKQSKGCRFEGSLSELIAHFSNCYESQILSDEVQSEVIKLLRRDIDSLKAENRVIVQKYDKAVKEQEELKNIVDVANLRIRQWIQINEI